MDLGKSPKVGRSGLASPCDAGGSEDLELSSYGTEVDTDSQNNQLSVFNSGNNLRFKGVNMSGIGMVRIHEFSDFRVLRYEEISVSVGVEIDGGAVGSGEVLEFVVEVSGLRDFH